MFSKYLLFTVVDNFAELVGNPAAILAMAANLDFRKQEIARLYPHFNALDCADFFSIHFSAVLNGEIVAVMRLVPVQGHLTYGSISHYLQAIDHDPEFSPEFRQKILEVMAGQRAPQYCEFGKVVVCERFRAKKSGIKEELFKAAVRYALRKNHTKFISITNEAAKMSQAFFPIGFRELHSQELTHASGTKGKLLICENIDGSYLENIVRESERIDRSCRIFSVDAKLATADSIPEPTLYFQGGQEHGG